MKNRTFAKLISLMLALLMVVTVFAACNKDGGNGDNNEGETTASNQNGGNENGAPADAYTADTEGAVDLSEYTVIRPKEIDGDGTKAIATFTNYLKEYCGVDIVAKRDNTVPNKSGKEILIGLTDRQESIDAHKGLKTQDWTVTVKGDKIVVAAGSETSLVNATNWIVENALQKNNKYAKIGTGNTYNHAYLASEVKVGDKAYTDATVVILSKDNVGFVDAALLLADNLTITAGLNTSVAKSASAAKGLKITVGSAFVANAIGIMPNGLTVGAGQYAICKVGDNLMIIADDAIGAEVAAQKILKAIIGADKKAVDLATLCTTGAVAYDYAADALDVTYGAEYRIMSYNIERTQYSGTGRYDLAVNAVKFYNPDVVGFQEFCVDYTANVAPKLVEAGYTMVDPVPALYSEEDNVCGTGNRTDRYSMTNNYTPIAFKTAKFDLVASGAQRIIPCRPHEEVINEETQETTVIYENTVQPTLGWPGYTITWAVLKDKTTGDTFAVTSLHNSTSSDTEGIEAKAKSFKEIVMPLVEKIAADNKCPVFMTGDYNSPVTTDDIADTLLGGERKIVNSMDKAVRGHAEGSSHGPKGVLTVNTKGKAIDHIFMTGEATVVRHRYGLSQVTSDASDHRPVMIDVVI